MSLQPVRQLARACLDMWASPRLAGFIAFSIYSVFSVSQGPIWRETSHNYFPYLADAFLHGQLNLRLIPPLSQLDLVVYHRLYYLYWPPMPAILLMPLVSVLGVHISDVLLVMILGGVNVMLVGMILQKADEKGVAPLDADRRALLTVFFALGSAALPLAPLGKVWATGQFVALLFIALAYLTTLSMHGQKAFFLTGLFIGCAFLTRNHTFLIGIWPAYYLLSTHWKDGINKVVRYSLLAVLPLIIFGSLTLLYNYARFGDPLQVGFDYQQMSIFFVKTFTKYGPFNLHYVPTNFYYQYIFYPFPWRNESWLGGSLFLMSPILFSIFFGIGHGRPRLSVLFLCLSILLTSIPILVLSGTGWVQVGPRYTLDFTVNLILLAAMGIRNWPRWVIALLVAISCAHYIIGTIALLTSH